MTFTLLEIRRMLADKTTLFFSTALPVAMYLMFGALQPFAQEELGRASVGARVLVSMTLYGALVGVVATVGTSVIEARQGWARQLALTPLSPLHRTLTQLAAALVAGAFPIVATLTVGALTGVRMPGWCWFAVAGLCLISTVPWVFYGLAWALAWPRSAAVAVASTLIVVLGFAGNMFTPLPADLLGWARWTPTWGVNVLAGYPVAQGLQPIQDPPYLVAEQWWPALLSAIMWTVMFALSCAVVAFWRREHKA
ncbi:ABC transporter permease [Corynebacterium uberis]|uniref:ABC transporter permease n=1 Tax=Corynebacterium TaxID=1716 RepID=UPI001D0A7926|nr:MULTISPECIES: ABC transporter permease [Corynebacterium]MCZ9310138.1 ABC transporter permease [Corynebacterium sp. c6VSa_13]UDL73279.1 ABC transporter permease [Corynebacterium uberis]UDL75843.1 ABC transporter permease [Corynebacterium uberis]UDL78056.1 ABC transporter permease [Corynebacterium uberis]UDL80338.1 ABC transporter permease [Corynebacterium uberis]